MSGSTAARPIYLDHHASTPVDPRVAEVVLRHMVESFGNASSEGHVHGAAAAAAVEWARGEVGRLVGAPEGRVVFTSGATEALNLALRGFALRRLRARRRTPVRIALAPTEHAAVLDTCAALEEEALAERVWIPVDGRGRLDLSALEDVCRTGVDVVAVMAANNEIGTVHPLAGVCEIARNQGAVVVCDATQAAGKVGIYAEEWGVQAVAFAAHKMYGPQGVGALVISPGFEVAPLLRGGGHEEGIRPGTLNLPGIAGFGEACRLRRLEMGSDEPRIAALRDRLQRLLQVDIPDLVVNGDCERRLAGNLHVSVPGAPNAAIQALLRPVVTLSTSSACASGAIEPSHVLRAIGLPAALQDGALRLGLGRSTTADEVDAAAAHIIAAAGVVRG